MTETELLGPSVKLDDRFELTDKGDGCRINAVSYIIYFDRGEVVFYGTPLGRCKHDEENGVIEDEHDTVAIKVNDDTHPMYIYKVGIPPHLVARIRSEFMARRLDG
jgi:hypothetical protein